MGVTFQFSLILCFRCAVFLWVCAKRKGFFSQLSWPDRSQRSRAATFAKLYSCARHVECNSEWKPVTVTGARLDIDHCCETALYIFLKTCYNLIKGNCRHHIVICLFNSPAALWKLIFFCTYPQVSFLCGSEHSWNRLGSVPKRDSECHHQPAEPTKVSTVCLTVVSLPSQLGVLEPCQLCVLVFMGGQMIKSLVSPKYK